MIKVISVKFKGGGKSYYFAPCAQDVEKGTGVIVETSKGLEYAIVTEGMHEVEESAIVPPLMPAVRIATQSDLEQIEKNEARKDDAMKIVREKIEARQLDMKPVGCEFSFDGTKIIIYFTSENRVDFRELIKDLSSAFRMRIELRQIGIREEIKLMGGLAPCGRECCCVRSLQEPKKVSVKMAKNQGLSLNPSKISGLCGRLMCCLSYENDYYADVCKKVPKLGSEATTPDGKGMVVNVNMLKMIVKVKIEQGDSVTYKDFPLDKISFMRGNEVIGAVGDDDEDEEMQEAEGTVSVDEAAPEGSDRADGNFTEGKNSERRHGDKNRDKRGSDRQNRQIGEEQSGDKPEIVQGKDIVQGNGKNRNKKHKRHGKQGEIKGEKDNSQNPNHKQNQQIGKGEKVKNVQSSATNPNATNPNANTQEGQGNGRSRKKHRFNKNRGTKDGAANKVNTEGQKNNA